MVLFYIVGCIGNYNYKNYKAKQYFWEFAGKLEEI